MINTLKSEWYRVIHGQEIYKAMGILSGLAVLVNGILWAATAAIDDFRYGSVRFSLSNMTASLTLLFVVGGIIAALLFAGEKHFGTLKNEVAYGISREKVLVVKCIVSIAVSLCCLAVVLVFYIGSACLLLDGPARESVSLMLGGIGSALPSAFAAVILAVVLLQLIERNFLAIIVWYMILFVIPKILYFAGFKVEVLGKIAGWMPWTLFSSRVVVTMEDFVVPWTSGFGLMQCLISGTVCCVLFLAAGFVLCRKKDI